jgi:hypothetical protein
MVRSAGTDEAVPEMFERAVVERHSIGRARLATTSVSLLGHAGLLVIAIGVSLVASTHVVPPTPRQTLAFVVPTLPTMPPLTLNGRPHPFVLTVTVTYSVG